MTHDLLRAVRFLLLPTLGVLFVLAFLPGRLELAIRVYALVLAVAAVALALAALRRAYPAATSLRRRQPRVEQRRRVPPSLARLEHLTVLGVAGAFDFHHRLRPRLRSLALGLLSTRSRVSLDGDPETARRILGDETWEIVRVDRQPPEERLGPGLPLDELRHVVESLESL